jgi:hypothetical protein
VRIGILEARSNRDLGIAGIIGAVLVTRGATWAFAVGFILTLSWWQKKACPTSASAGPITGQPSWPTRTLFESEPGFQAMIEGKEY